MKQILVCAAALLMTPLAAYAQTGRAFSPPRTPAGHPDFQGTWTNASLTRLERVPEFKSLVISTEDAIKWEKDAASVAAADSAVTDPGKGAPAAGEDPAGYNYFWIDPGKHVGMVNGEYRSSWITDPENGKVPYTRDGRAAMMKAVSTFNRFDNPEERIPIERCLIGFGSTGGPPMLNVLYNNHQQIIQTPDAIAINIEMVHDTRIIRIDGKHRPGRCAPVPRQHHRALGGRYACGGNGRLQAAGKHPCRLRPVSLHVARCESHRAVPAREQGRDSRISSPSRTPATYTQPWSGELTFRRSPERIYEYACHEGNYSVPNILGGAREMERTHRKAAVTPPIGRLDRPAKTN